MRKIRNGNLIVSVVWALFLALLPGQARAWFHFEPGIGYTSGQEQVSQVQGIGLALRLGFDFNNAFVVADTDYGSLQMGSTANVVFSDAGLTFGGKVNGYRIWYGVIASSSYKTPGDTPITTTGSGSKLGVGGTITSGTSLNLEVRSISYTKNTNGAVSELGTYGFFSVSWPL